MDLIDQAIHALLDGVDQGTANMVTLGTTAAATELWRQLRSHLSRKPRALTDGGRQVLEAEPGQQVDLSVLREILRMLPPAALENSLRVHGDYVGGDYVAGTYIAGDYVAGDYVAGDQFGGDKVAGDKNIFNIGGN